MTGHELLIFSGGVNLGVMWMLAVHIGGQLSDARKARVPQVVVEELLTEDERKGDQ